MTQEELDLIRQHGCEPPAEMKLSWAIAGIRITEILEKDKAFDAPLC